MNKFNTYFSHSEGDVTEEAPLIDEAKVVDGNPDLHTNERQCICSKLPESKNCKFLNAFMLSFLNISLCNWV